MVIPASMKFAYADPPYLGCGKRYTAHHSDALAWNDPATHQKLVERLCDEYPDGWVLSLHAPSWDIIKPMCPADARTGIWVKPFAIFKPNVNPAYAFEPVIFRGGRKFTREDRTIRDWVAANITLRRGLTGAKPPVFCRWVISLLNAHPEDTFDDLFPGTGAFSDAWSNWRTEITSRSIEW